MLKLFLLIPLITLNVAMTLGLIYFTAFVNPGAGFLRMFALRGFPVCHGVLILHHTIEAL